MSIIIVLLVIVLLFGNLYFLFVKVPMYQSTTKLVLVSESNHQTGITQGDVQLNSNLVATYTEIVKSKDILNKVIKYLDLEDETVDSLNKKITVSTTTNTQTINIRVIDSDNKKAKMISDELARVFSEEISKIYKLDNVYVYEKATLATSPYNMNIIKDNIIFIGIGLVLGLGIVFCMFMLDTTIKSVEDVEDRLQLNVLGRLPMVGDIE